MKVITEERLRQKVVGLTADFGKCDLDELHLIENLIYNELQELDTLTVTKLRPMSEAKDGEEILVKFVWGNELVKVEYGDGVVFREDDSCYYIKDCDGFIPMPRYEPERA